MKIYRQMKTGIFSLKLEFQMKTEIQLELKEYRKATRKDLVVWTGQLAAHDVVTFHLSEACDTHWRVYVPA